MDYFKGIYEKIMKIEGGWCNVEGDNGGETYKGIARNYQQKWKGWGIIDKIKNKMGNITVSALNNLLSEDKNLQELVVDFYREKYWRGIKLDEISEFSPIIAEEIFDSYINIGGNVLKWLQIIINSLNYKKGSSHVMMAFEDLVVDGVIGAKTISALWLLSNIYDKTFVIGYIYTALNSYQFVHYVEISKNVSMRKFTAGWHNNRINFRRGYDSK